MRPNLILIGFMGSGKTSTGKALAALLGFTFLDTDQELERQAGMTIPEIFRNRGEAAFRGMERALLETLTGRDRQVLATGGGLWMDPSNRDRLLGSGYCLWLQAGPDQVWDRVQGDLPSRPLLAQAPDPKGKIRELLESRSPQYALAHGSVLTDRKTPEAVAREIIARLKERPPFDLPQLPS